jgi:branched-chain amino acid transport system permease protein
VTDQTAKVKGGATRGSGGAPPSDGARSWAGPLRVGLYVLAALAIALALRSPYTSQLLAFATLWALAAAGWNIVSGYGGQVSFGHAAFFGLGAYGAAYSGSVLGLSPWIGIFIGMVLSVLLALVVGYVSWRLSVRGIYFALVLFAVSELLRIIVANARPLGGTTGLYSAIREDGLITLSFADPRWFVLIGGVILALVLAGTAWMARSSLGRQMAAVRNDEVAAEASGIHAMRVKLIALGLSAPVTAIAGGLYAQIHLFVQPETVFGVTANLRIILIGFLGGVGAILGPILGSAGVTLVEAGTLELFQGVPGADGVAFGLLLVAAVTFLPHGIAALRLARPSRDVAPAPSAHHDDASRARREAPVGTTVPSRGASSTAPPLGERKPVLVGRDLSKSFGGLKVVDDVDMELREGTIHGLIGPNGAGKTTLLNLLAGAVRRDHGAIELLDRSVAGTPVFKRAHLGLARTFQVPRSSGDLSIWEAVWVAATASGRSQDPKGSAERALATVGLQGHERRIWNDLNGSEKRRFDVARCLAQEPIVLLLDEPMSGLGREEVEAMVELVRSLPIERPEMTVLIIEHNMKVIMSLAEHITVLERGKVLARGGPGEIMRHEGVIRAYLGRAET